MASYLGVVTRIDDTLLEDRRLAYAAVSEIADGFEIGPMEVADELEADLAVGDRVLLHTVDSIGDKHVVCCRLAGASS